MAENEKRYPLFCQISLFIFSHSSYVMAVVVKEYLEYITLAAARTLPKVSWVLLGISPPLKLALGLQLDYIDEQFKHL